MVRAWRPDPLWLVTGEHDVQRVSLPPGHENQVLFVLEQLHQNFGDLSRCVQEWARPSG